MALKQSMIRDAFIDPFLAIRTDSGPLRAFHIGTRMHQGRVQVWKVIPGIIVKTNIYHSLTKNTVTYDCGVSFTVVLDPEESDARVAPACTVTEKWCDEHD